MTIVLLSTAYFGGGAAIRRARGDKGSLPNPEFWASLGGLVWDGCSLVLSGGVAKGAIEYDDLSDAANDVRRTEDGNYRAGSNGPDEQAAAPLLGCQATRGAPNSLHSAASLGDDSKLLKLLGSTKCPPIDDGDTRRYTPFHVACAGGHVGAARLLRNYGADTSLTNDQGLTAWELAEHLRRLEVVALQQEAPEYQPQPQAAKSTGDNRKHKRKSKRRESAPEVSGRASSMSTAPEGAGSQVRPRRSSAAAVTDSAISGGLEESKALKAELKQLGLSAKGSKAQLRQRLEDAKSGAAK